ncbi:unnamed protein product [Phaedon cochleariae]|uniref:TMEM205-like domain-containing protein n=1 Tax=Phaedon cochleariae TaxID=80249 RepID=A0A9P0GL80_PHACE|nr:unnamed protein product [Phaedon cochleariae]
MCVSRLPSEIEFQRTNTNNKDVSGFVPKKAKSEAKSNGVVLRGLKFSRKVSKTVVSASKNEYEEDILAVSTRYTKDFFAYLQSQYHRFLTTNFYKILVYTTQPAHFVTAVSVIWIAYLMYPSKSHTPMSPLWNLVYLGSFSAHFGAQIWMTFVSGLALYFTLSRHTFGTIQQVLFPKYFLMNAVLSLITLVIYLRTNNHKFNETETIIQTTAMSLCFMVELIVRLYLSPPLLSLIGEKHLIEKEAGIGMEIGKINLGSLKNCPFYMKIHKKFRKIHMTIAMLNLIAMACTVLQLYYLSHKLCAL